MVDFEQGPHKTLEKAFRAKYLRGCLFHYCQAVYRKVVEFGFLADYKDTNSDIRLGVRRLLALPFLPEDDVEQSFEELKDYLPATLQPIVDYFSRTWIGNDAIFSVQLWSQFHNVLSHQSRTNNHAEGFHFHSALKKFCGGAHLSFWKFLDVLILQHNLSKLDVIKHLSNVPPPPRQKKYRL